MLELLEQLFRQVRTYMHSERFNRHQIYFQSPHHITMQFDHEAEDIIINGLIKSGQGFEIISEERAAFTTSSTPHHRIVVDPIDGSTNVVRGIMTAAVSLAVLPIDAPIDPKQVQWALVGELFSGTVYQAQRGSGAFRNGQRCHVSKTEQLQDSIVGMNFDGRDLTTLQKLLIQKPTPRKVRRTGSSAMDIVYVASGAYDAFVDIGDVITAESFLAALTIVSEAGGVFSDLHSKNLHDIPNLTERFSLVVAGTQQLHQQILAKIQ
jgi:fructose-1,6-bisphosphatase/inositol monophosphatase family enzyme